MKMKEKEKYSLRWAKKIKAVNMLGGKCINCGNDDIFVLQFHHIKGNKGHDVQDLLRRSRRWSDVEKEINKCILLCANCHHKKHRSKDTEAKVKLLELIGKDRCEKCGRIPDNLFELCFHHIEEKKFEIGWALGRQKSYPVEKVLGEAKKCIILCINCHIKEHIDFTKFNNLEHSIYEKVNRHKERPVLDWNVIKRMKDVEQLSTNEIARKLGCSRAAVWWSLKNN